jgi:GMP synthase (glutamine-hydrolysing)
MFYQWHYETFDTPPDAVHLAAGDRFESQAFRYNKHVYGVEFHPEMTYEMIDRWSGSERGRRKIEVHGAQSREAQLANYRRYAGATDRWLDEFLDRCLLCPPIAVA